MNSSTEENEDLVYEPQSILFNDNNKNAAFKTA